MSHLLELQVFTDGIHGLSTYACARTRTHARTHACTHARTHSSSIDLTIANSRLVRYVSDWTCGEEESCSDHNIVNFKIASVNNGKGKMNYMGVRYITNQEGYKKFDNNLVANFISTFNLLTRRTPIN
jgi:hypothetical protein